MAIGISPLVDFAFKLLLGSPEHSGMAQRLTYNVSSLYVGQLGEGQEYSGLRPAICICVLSLTMFAEPPALHLDYRLREISTAQTLTDDLQIHLLQVKHLQVTAEAVYQATPAERWAYFLQNAEKLSPAEIRQLFPDQEFSEAAGVLEMISRTPEQLMADHARRKFQRDEVAKILQARMEGRQEGEEIGEARGEARGELRGRIVILQELLGHRVWSTEEFSASDAAQLNALANQLQQQLRARNS